MAKLIVVRREQVEAANQRIETLLAQDPRHQEENREREVEETQEKRRRDTENRTRESEARRISFAIVEVTDSVASRGGVMALNPFFSLTAMSPNALTYDSANPTNPYANATLRSNGGY